MPSNTVSYEELGRQMDAIMTKILNLESRTKTLSEQAVAAHKERQEKQTQLLSMKKTVDDQLFGINTFLEGLTELPEVVKVNTKPPVKTAPTTLNAPASTPTSTPTPTPTPKSVEPKPSIKSVPPKPEITPAPALPSTPSSVPPPASTAPVSTGIPAPASVSSTLTEPPVDLVTTKPVTSISSDSGLDNLLEEDPASELEIDPTTGFPKARV